MKLDDFGKRGENRPLEDNDYEWDDWQETTFNDGWRDESLLEFNDDHPGGEIPNPRKDASVMKRAYTEDKKNLLRKLNINIRKGDGPNAKSLFERIKITANRKGNVNGVEFDGVKIIVLEGKTLRFTKNVKLKSKLYEFNSLVKEAEKENEKTVAALIEDSIPGVFVDDNLAESVLNDSLDRLNEEISKRADEITAELTENEIREFRGILDVKLPTLEQQREGGITVEDRIDAVKTEETHWRDLAERAQQAEKKLLYKSIADVAALKPTSYVFVLTFVPKTKLHKTL